VKTHPPSPEAMAGQEAHIIKYSFIGLINYNSLIGSISYNSLIGLISFISLIRLNQFNK